jgi:hypothetical protein
MAVKIIPDPDVYLTPSEHGRYLDEYRRCFSFYSGTPPSFNAWVARRKEAERGASTQEGQSK